MRMGTSVALVGAVMMTAALSACGGGTTASAPREMAMTTNLSGAQEVPPVNTPASGRARTWYDRSTRSLTWTVDAQGLSGPLTAAHFHGPAAPGQNAGVQVPISTAAMPMTGAATLTPAQEADLLAGRWYVNLHTAANPNGEIRGQVTAGP